MHNVLRLNKAGMKGNQHKMDGIAHNLANVNTYGYKRQEVNFEELRLREVGKEVLKSDNAENLRLSMGARSGFTKSTFNQGAITPAAGKFNMAISGDGFFGVRGRDGNLLLTRNGSFHQNEDGSVSDAMGNNLEMETYMPFESWTGDIAISGGGDIYTVEDGENINLGRLILFKADNPDNLLAMGDGNYIIKDGGNLEASTFSMEGFGEVKQFFLEESNVDMAKSMVDMIITQRAYSINGKALNTTDEIMTMVNNMKR